MRYFILIILISSCSIVFSQQSKECNDVELGNVEFNKKSAKLNSKAKKKLDSLVPLINQQPDCVVLATSSYADFCDKCGALSWDRAEAVLNYLAQKGVLKDRLRFTAKIEGNLNFVSLTISSWKVTDEAPPHPSQRKKD